jgi:nicotinamide mononucleotide adenylyltransferase
MKFKEFIQESKENHAVLAFGRMNPPTTGHGKLVDKVKDVAKENNASHHVVLSHSQDKAKNPLSAEAKLKHAKRFFPNTNLSVSNKEHPTFLHHAAKLHKQGVTHLHMIAGSDRVDEYKKKLSQYNGTHKDALYNFKKITVHSAGQRDPDAEGTEGMSASKMRGHASGGNLWCCQFLYAGICGFVYVCRLY